MDRCPLILEGVCSRFTAIDVESSKLHYLKANRVSAFHRILGVCCRQLCPVRSTTTESVSDQPQHGWVNEGPTHAWHQTSGLKRYRVDGVRARHSPSTCEYGKERHGTERATVTARLVYVPDKMGRCQDSWREQALEICLHCSEVFLAKSTCALDGGLDCLHVERD